MRLHANLLFYGLDQGTWSDPPTGSAAAAGWTKTPWDSTESEQAVWDSPTETTTPSTAISMNFGVEQSTDEGSDAKGSESDSLPDSNEGYLVTNQAIPGSPPMIPAYMNATAAGLCSAGPAGSMVSQHATTPTDAASVYSPYLSTGSFLTTHGFGNGDVASAYGYDVGHSLNSSFPAISGIASGVMDTAGASVGDAAGTDGVPSIGSYAHLSGQCSRCCFHPKGRCANGYNCEFCHYHHDKRPRNGKKKRYRRQLDGSSEDGVGFQVGGLD